MIRVRLPHHLRTVAGTAAEVELKVEGPLTLTRALDALEAEYPMLRGTVRDYGTGRRRPFIRFYAADEDVSQTPPDQLLPAAVASGEEPLHIVGAMVGG